MRRDELTPVVLEDLLLGTTGAKRLAEQHEVRDSGDQLLDGGPFRVEDPGLGLPQRSGHLRSVIGADQEMVKPAKTFSKLSLS